MRRIMQLLFGVWASCALALPLQVVTEELPPLSFRDQGVLTGYATELMQAVFSQAKIQAEIDVYPWPRAYHVAATTPNTVIFSMGKTPEREPLFHWIGPLGHISTWMYKHADNKTLVVNSLSDIYGLRIGVIRKSVADELLRKEIGVRHLMRVNSQVQLLKLLTSNRVDLAVIAQPVLVSLKQDNTELVELLVPVYLLERTPVYAGISIQSSPQLVEQLQAAFSRVIETDLKRALMAKYFPEEQAAVQY
jgi:polar amino acid transport system substrate-binding protein